MGPWSAILGQCPCNGGSRFPWGVWVLAAGGLYAVTWWAESIKKKEGTSRMMNKLGKLAVVAVLIAAVGVVVAMKRARSSESAAQPAVQDNAVQANIAQTGASTSQASAVQTDIARTPRLVDLGSTSCIPCRMMMPILEQLRTEQAGRLQVDFIDVWKDQAAGQKYGVNVIPTQIFLDRAGKELWRHEGFLAKEQILDKWKELGFELPEVTTSQPADEAEAS